MINAERGEQKVANAEKQQKKTRTWKHVKQFAYIGERVHTRTRQNQKRRRLAKNVDTDSRAEPNYTYKHTLHCSQLIKMRTKLYET